MEAVRAPSHIDLHLILREGGRILLGRRIDTGFADGSYALPAGHLEEGEAATAGLVREAAEEIGIEIDAADLRYVHTMHHRTDSSRLALFFETTVWKGKIENREPRKCAGWQWHAANALPSPIVPYVAEALAHVARGVTFSERGWEIEPE